jgi:hypothetical protein
MSRCFHFCFNLAVNFNFRRFTELRAVIHKLFREGRGTRDLCGRGAHSSTSQLNLCRC